MPDRTYLFRDFELLPAERILLRDGNPVHLRSRAFDVLLALVERAGRLVGKAELMDLVWPGLAVEENNLTVQLSALRRALGDRPPGQRLIATVSRRGYRFTAPVRALLRDAPGPAWDVPAAADPARRHNLPAPLSRLIGREAALGTLGGALRRDRLVTVLGPGGIGKTSLALAAAWQALPELRDGAWQVELAPHADPAAVPAAIAAALGLQARPATTLADATEALRRQQALLLLDNCEHLIQDAAQSAEALLRTCPGLRVLATSREPLGCEGEAVYRLPPLGLAWPGAAGPGHPLTASEALRAPAVALFVERAAAALGGFELRDSDAPAVVEICRRVDGIPLAIEMAAGRLRTLGLCAVRDRLDDALSLLVSGRRTALARQRTLRATLEWSFRLLEAADQDLVRRLSVFPASFCATAAAGVAAGPGPSPAPARIDDRLAALVDRSLLAAELRGPEPRYSLLEVTRQYGAEQLAPAEARGLRDGLVRWCADRLGTAHAAWDTSDDAGWTARFGPDIHDVRAALRHALAPGGDAAGGVTVASFAPPLWEQLTLAAEHERWVGAALSHATDATPPQELARLRLARFQWHTLADPRPLDDAHAAAALFRRAGDRRGEAQALLVCAFAQLSGPDRLPAAEGALGAAARLLAEAPPGRGAAQLRRLRGIARWFAGDRALAQREFEAAMALCRDHGFMGIYVRTAGSLAQRLCAEGEFAQAEAAARHALDLCDGDLAWSAPAIHLTGLLASYLVAQGDLRGGAAAARTALSRARTRGLRHEWVWGVERCAVSGAEQAPEDAAALLGYCDEAYRANGRQRFEQSVERYDAAIGRLRRALGPARLAAAMAAGAAFPDPEAVDRAIHLAGMVAGTGGDGPHGRR